MGAGFPRTPGRQLLGDGGEARQHRDTPGCRDVQQVVGACVDDDPAAPVSHHVIRVGVVRRLAGDRAETGRRLRMSGRESGDIDDPGLPARDQPESAEGRCKRFGQQVVAAVLIHQEIIDRHSFLAVPVGDRGWAGDLLDVFLDHRGKLAQYRADLAAGGDREDSSRLACAVLRCPRCLGGRAGCAVRGADRTACAGLCHDQACARHHEVPGRVEPSLYDRFLDTGWCGSGHGRNGCCARQRCR